MNSRSLRALCILALLSILVSCLALGASYQRIDAGFKSPALSSRISKDGWVKDGAHIYLPQLLPYGNRLELQFDPWRPPVPPSVISVAVCGKALGEYLIEAGTQITISLEGNCEPRSVHFGVPHPIQLSEQDKRLVGAQLAGVKVSSALGIPLLSTQALALSSILLFILSAMAWATFRPAGLQALSLIIVALSYLPLRRVDILNPETPIALALCISLLLFGIVVADKTKSAGSGSHGNLLPGFVVLIITALAAYLRWTGIRFGLPHNFHPDEVPKVNAIMTMVQAGDLNPRYFLHPSLLLYATYAMNTFLHWVGIEGEFRETAFFAGRLVSACAGTLSVYLTYALARRVISPWGAVVAASLLAVFPLHVTCSRYLKEDSLLLFWVLLASLCCLKAAQEKKVVPLMLGAMAAGLACATKYSGLVCFGIFAATPWLSNSLRLSNPAFWKPDTRLLKWTCVAGFVGVICFFAASPYIILDYPKFQSDFAYERKHMVRGHTEAIDAWSQFWMYHIWYSLRRAVTNIPLIAGLIGLGLLLARRSFSAWFIVGLFALFYLPAEWVRSKPAPQPERYIVPCLPFLAIAAASLCERFAKIPVLAALVAILIGAVPASTSVKLAQELTYDTREQARDWFLSHVPAGAKVLIDWEPYNIELPTSQYESEYFRREKISTYLHPKTLKESQFDYLVLSTLFYERYFSQPKADPAIRRRFEAVFRKVPIVREFMAATGSYGFHNPTITIFDLSDGAYEHLEAELAAHKKDPSVETSNQRLSNLPWTTLAGTKP